MLPASADLTERSTHFEFGENWAQFADQISERDIGAATDSVRRLLPDIENKTFLDLGSGSGLFSAAALRLGASRVHAIDIDENSVATTRRVLTRFAPRPSWTAERRSVFDLSPATMGQFDAVYSWGVLHHTGDMWRAIDCASQMTAPGGIFAFSLYERTPLCGAWRFEKRVYSRAPRVVQRLLCSTYKSLYSLALLVSGREGTASREARGMNLDHDIHDWMGGYPYESTDPKEVAGRLDRLGFDRVVESRVKVHLGGVFGTGCSEYVYRRRT